MAYGRRDRPSAQIPLQGYDGQVRRFSGYLNLNQSISMLAFPMS